VIDEAKLAELRSALEEQRENLRREIVDLGGDPDSDDASIDVERGFADSAHSTAERARSLSVMKALRANPLERLEALPWAILCVDCARKGEGR
jgi:RNA polymerase-binding transcription factor DksA